MLGLDKAPRGQMQRLKLRKGKGMIKSHTVGCTYGMWIQQSSSIVCALTQRVIKQDPSLRTESEIQTNRAQGGFRKEWLAQVGGPLYSSISSIL
jgi:hypothetical protein